MNVMYEDGAFKLTRAHETDAGLDVRAMHDGIVRAHKSATFHTGVHCQLPPNTMGDIRPKSGMMFNHDILTFGTVDVGYDGEVMVHMMNLSDDDYWVLRGDKIAQMAVVKVIFEPVETVTEIEGGERGMAGFGSTGVR